MKLAWIVLCLLPLGGLSAQETQPPKAGFTELLMGSVSSPNPSLSFLQGLGSLDAEDVTQDELWAALDEIEGRGIRLPVSLVEILDAVDTISIRGEAPRHVRFRFRADVAPLDLGPGWAHLEREVSFEIHTGADRQVTLSAFDGFKLSKKRGSWIKVRMQEVRFETTAATSVAYVDAGAGGTHEIALGNTAEAGDPSPVLMADRAPPPPSYTQGVIGTLDDSGPEKDVRYN